MTLEEEFKKLVDDHMNEIKAEVQKASKALREACVLSERYGIPFDSPVSMIDQTYTPETFAKFNGLDDELVRELTDSYPNYDYCGGWEHSAVC